MDLGTFFVDQIVVHDVPRNDAKTTPADIVYSDAASPLTAELRNFFKEKATQSLGRHGYAVEHDPEQTSPVPALIEGVLKDVDQLIPASQEIARHLYDSQPAVSNPGLLVALLGRLEGTICLGILKLEREDAIRVEETTAPGGGRTFSVAHLRDLMLGKHTRLFKASAFRMPGATLDSLEGVVSDDQRGYNPATEVATYFLARFLGARLRTAPDVATKSFFEATQDWIESEVPEPEKKARYEIALLGEMNRQAPTLTPNSFAAQNLDVEDRQGFRDSLVAAEVSTASIEKDLKLIASRVKRLSMRFAQSKLKLSGPPEDIEKFVTVNPADSEAAPVEIHDRIDEVSGGG
jgi:37-kD nucleoid-associated bacterial protein